MVKTCYFYINMDIWSQTINTKKLLADKNEGHHLQHITDLSCVLVKFIRQPWRDFFIFFLHLTCGWVILHWQRSRDCDQLLLNGENLSRVAEWLIGRDRASSWHGDDTLGDCDDLRLAAGGTVNASLYWFCNWKKINLFKYLQESKIKLLSIPIHNGNSKYTYWIF